MLLSRWCSGLLRPGWEAAPILLPPTPQHRKESSLPGVKTYDILSDLQVHCGCVQNNNSVILNVFSLDLVVAFAVAIYRFYLKCLCVLSALLMFLVPLEA